jgi:DNA-binding transcriptional regulator LsrR (DeoR family)
VCNLLCEGYTVKKMQQVVLEKYPDAVLKREDFYGLVRYAARRGWLSFQPPQNHRLADQIRARHAWLRGVRVVHTAVLRDVANEAALALVGLLQAYRREWDRQEVHIGFTGGHSMRMLARSFADRLSEPPEELPDSVVFHALAAGFDPTDPTTNPNAFFTYFLNKPMLQVKPSFLGLSAPAMVTPEALEAMKELADIKDAFASVRGLDIVVTSGADWSDEDCALRRRMQGSTASVEALQNEGCVGDILWRPIADHGPIETETELRALSLIELGQLPTIIRGGTRVLLMLGPCGRCGDPKGRLLRCVLQQRRPIITDLVVDSRTASDLGRAGAEELEH